MTNKPLDLMKMWARFEAEVAAAPLLDDAEIAKLAHVFLKEHQGMIGAALAEIERKNEEPVSDHIRKIRQQLHQLNVLDYKRSGVPLLTRRLRIVR